MVFKKSEIKIPYSSDELGTGDGVGGLPLCRRQLCESSQILGARKKACEELPQYEISIMQFSSGESNELHPARRLNELVMISIRIRNRQVHRVADYEEATVHPARAMRRDAIESEFTRNLERQPGVYVCRTISPGGAYCY